VILNEIISETNCLIPVDVIVQAHWSRRLQ